MVRNIPKGSDRHLKLAAVDGTVVTQGTVAADVPVEMPPKPRGISANERLSALWDAIVPELYEAGICSRVEWPVLEVMIRHFAAAEIASDALKAGGPTVWDEKSGRWMKNPAEVVFRSESMAFMAYAREAGMTFAARASRPSSRGAGEGNPFAPGRGSK